MTIFLDYYMPDSVTGVTNVGIRQESGTFKPYKVSEFPKVVEELIGRELIVTYGKPLYNLSKALTGYELYLEDFEVRKRWYDLASEIRKITGKQIALSKVAKSVLGIGPESKILRLKESFDPIERTDIEPKMEDKLSVLQQVFDYAVLHNQLSFLQRQETTWLDIEINESVV